MNTSRFKLAYGTYGMPKIEPAAALPRLKEMGYEGIEICVAEAWPTAPGKMSKPARQALRGQLADLGLEVPSLMLLSRVLTDKPDDYRKQLDEFRAAAEMAVDLASGSAPPPLTTTLGGGPLTWEKDREQIADRVAEWGRVAASMGVQFAVEPHVGGILAKPERAVWLLARVPAPAVRLNFDISHFAIAGYPTDEVVDLLAPLAIHTHVKDGRMVGGKVQFLLPGEGGFDYVAYFRAMARAGWRGHITVEVSGMIFNKPDYDPWAAAKFSFDTLQAARKQMEA
ncbi:MAG: sugar phosphate isomerase/epimerase [Planctomycetes bacterium]|nr:sugar phosphate isomerase/epimerase [Planctomycetota bacterium]